MCLPPPEAARAPIQQAEATEQQENCGKDKKPLLLTPNCTVSHVGPGCWWGGGAGEPQEVLEPRGREGGQLPPPAPGPNIPSGWEPSPHLCDVSPSCPAHQVHGLARETGVGAVSPGRARERGGVRGGRTGLPVTDDVSSEALDPRALTPPWGKINLRLRCSVVKNPPASAGDPGSIPGPGGFHVQCSSRARRPRVRRLRWRLGGNN